MTIATISSVLRLGNPGWSWAPRTQSYTYRDGERLLLLQFGKYSMTDISRECVDELWSDGVPHYFSISYAKVATIYIGYNQFVLTRWKRSIIKYSLGWSNRFWSIVEICVVRCPVNDDRVLPALGTDESIDHDHTSCIVIPQWKNSTVYAIATP